jgi:hypothetical protein
MSVEIAVSALSMPQSLSSLKMVTPLGMHRITFEIPDVKIWYQIMSEARAQYGKNWRTQPKAKRKLDSWRPQGSPPIKVWFEVPDPAFATWVAVKLGVPVAGAVNK